MPSPDFPPSPAITPNPHKARLGVAGETLVAGWLQAAGWEILHRRWRSRWGEIDLIARYSREEGRRSQSSVGFSQGRRYANDEWSQHSAEDSIPSAFLAKPSDTILAFVEVKTRSRGNWDEDGLLSIGDRKQAKLWKTATSFLAAHPQWEDCSCRFDVALVRCLGKVSSTQTSVEMNSQRAIILGEAIEIDGYRLVLQDYIESAFG